MAHTAVVSEQRPRLGARAPGRTMIGFCSPHPVCAAVVALPCSASARKSAESASWSSCSALPPVRKSAELWVGCTCPEPLETC